MPLLIGMDEAGYGPNLGPLVITAVAWEVPSDPRQTNLFSEFSGILSPEPGDAERLLHIGDSKAVYTPSRGLAPLEAGVLAALRLQERQAGTRALTTFRGVCRHLNHAFDDDPPAPWAAERDLPIPHVLNGMGPYTRVRSAELGDAWHDRCNLRQVRLRGIRSDVISPKRFNARTRLHGSKGRALSELSFELLASLWRDAQVCDDEVALIIADKHGGRNRYHEFLPIVFGDRFIRCREESLHLSSYQIGKAEIRLETKSERHLPVALASMFSKYLRELAMVQFNAFWTTRIPGLKPTAGYPLDARRFRAAIQELQRQLNIADDDLWREK